MHPKFLKQKRPKQFLLLIFHIFFFPLNTIVSWILSKKEREASKKTCERYQDLSKEYTNKNFQCVPKRCRHLKRRKRKSNFAYLYFQS